MRLSNNIHSSLLGDRCQEFSSFEANNPECLTSLVPPMLSLSCASYIKGTRGQTLGWAEVQFSFLTQLTSGLTSDVDLFGCSEILPCLGSYAQSAVCPPCSSPTSDARSSSVWAHPCSFHLTTGRPTSALPGDQGDLFRKAVAPRACCGVGRALEICTGWGSGGC